jgi:hypothetical protein
MIMSTQTTSTSIRVKPASSSIRCLTSSPAR